MVSDRIEILFLIDYFHRTGGTEKHLVQLISGLSPQQFRCTVVVFDLGDNPLLDALRNRGVPILHLPVGREYVPNALRQALRLYWLVRRNRFDIVQTYHQKADTFGALTAWFAGAQHLISSKRDTGQLRKPLHKFLNRRLRVLFDAFIMAADGVGVAVAAQDRLPAQRVVTIYNGVDANRFHPPSAEQRRAARARLGYAEQDFVVGMVAGFRPEKNHDVFFEGLSRAAPAIPSLRVLAVGGGDLLGQYRERLAASECGTHTVLTGDVADVLPYLWALDVGCLTPGSNEGFSNAVIEQMATALPLIVTDVGGNAEAVVDGATGWVIPPLDAPALGRALLRAHEDATRRIAMGVAARARVEALFSLERMCAEHARLYTSLSRPAPAPDR